MDIKKALLEKDKDCLAELIVALLDGLEENQRLDFIGKHIDAGVALETLAVKDQGVLSRENTVRQVEDFCAECLDGDYYVEAEYDHYSDSYDEEEYENSEWATRFTEYLRLAVIYARNGDCPTAFTMFKVIFDCIHKCDQDYELLGTASPLDYIDIDTADVFDVYFFTMCQVAESAFEAYENMFAIWTRYKQYCEPLLCKYIIDLSIAAEVVVRRNEEALDFSESEKLFLKLEELFIQRNKPFDKLSIARRLLSRHDNFSYYAACGYAEINQWEDAIHTIREYLDKTTGKTRKNLELLLTDCYERNGQINEAYANSLSLFFEHESYALYQRTRELADKVDGIGTDMFFELTKDYFLSTEKNYKVKRVYMEILSFEGKVMDLVALSHGSSSNTDYDILKYSAKSLVYRALRDTSGLPVALNEYITSIKQSELPGIVDMLPQKGAVSTARDLLLSAVDILKRQIQFHVAAASRSRYAKAAYYLGILVDIYTFLGEAEKGESYISLLMSQYNRKPAFKDEVRQKFKEGVGNSPFTVDRRL